MNPGVDVAYTGVLPQPVAVANTASATSRSVASPLTTSTSGISGAGLKKCMPTMRSGRLAPRAIAVTDNDDVFVARMHCGDTTFSSSATSSRFASISSTIASITSAATQVSASVPTVLIRASVASRSACDIRAFATSFASVSPIARFAASAAPKRVS